MKDLMRIVEAEPPSFGSLPPGDYSEADINGYRLTQSRQQVESLANRIASTSRNLAKAARVGKLEVAEQIRQEIDELTQEMNGYLNVWKAGGKLTRS